jgi:hypothetical protein
MLLSEMSNEELLRNLLEFASMLDCEINPEGVIEKEYLVIRKEVLSRMSDANNQCKC